MVYWSLSVTGWHVGGVDVQRHSFLTSRRDGGEWSTSGATFFLPPPRTKGHSAHWVGPRPVQHVLENGKISCPYRDSIPEPSSPYLITTLTELPRLPKNSNRQMTSSAIYSWRSTVQFIYILHSAGNIWVTVLCVHNEGKG
jgi:hypothetical protein